MLFLSLGGTSERVVLGLLKHIPFRTAAKSQCFAHVSDLPKMLARLQEIFQQRTPEIGEVFR